MVQRCGGSRRRQLRAISKNGDGSDFGRMGSPCPILSQTGARWVMLSTRVMPRDHTSLAGESLPLEDSGGSYTPGLGMRRVSLARRSPSVESLILSPTAMTFAGFR
jgi:hypothetical protein